MKSLILVLMIGVLMFGLVSAADSSLEVGVKVQANASENQNDNGGNSGVGAELSSEIHVKQEAIRNGNYIGPFGKLLDVRELSENLRELRSGNVSVETELNITSEEDDNNETHFKAHLDNGSESEIKIMPDVASATALARLKLKVCSVENNCTIVLKEVGENSTARVSYELKADQDVKVLGLFKAKMHTETQVDAETGEVVSVKQPWWAAISSK